MKKFLTTSLHYTSVFTTLRPDKTPWQANYHETILRILISKLKYRSNARFQSCASQHPSSFHFAVTGQSSFHFSLFCQLADTPRQDALAGRPTQSGLILADKELILLIINDRNVKKGWVQVYPATILHTSRLKPYSS